MSFKDKWSGLLRGSLHNLTLSSKTSRSQSKTVAMRFSYIYLLAVATFLASRDVASATANMDHAALTKIGLSANPTNVGNGNRSLRSQDAEDDFEPSPEWTKKWAARMNRWVDEGKEPLAVARYFSGNKYGINMSREARAKYNLFVDAWLKKNPDVPTNIGAN